jgi:hypothetical protein
MVGDQLGVWQLWWRRGEAPRETGIVQAASGVES